MGPDLATQLLKESMKLLLVVGGPLFFTLLIAGLLVGVLQAATQINDPAVGFIPRLVTTALILWFLGGWMAERFAGALASHLIRMGNPF